MSNQDITEVGPKLSDAFTPEEIEAIKAEMVPYDQATVVRFLHNGQNLTIQTGRLMAKGINVIHQTVYWNFTRETAKRIAAALKVTAVFSEG